MAAVKDGGLNHVAEGWLFVGDTASGKVEEELAMYMLRDVAASYVRNLTIPGSWNDPVYRGPRW